jgi:hypothetical protein
MEKNISIRIRNKYEFSQSLLKIQDNANKRDEYMREKLGTTDKPRRCKKERLSKQNHKQL